MRKIIKELLLVVAILLIKVTDAHDFNFIDDTLKAAKKCCAHSEYLNLARNDSLRCKSSGPHHFQIYAKQIVNNFNNNCRHENVTECVDFLLENGRKLVKVSKSCDSYEIIDAYNYFPKCCPLNYSYDSQKHHCVKNSETVRELSAEFQVLHLSLSECPNNTHAIKDLKENSDYKIDDGHDLVIDSRRSRRGNYCVDNDAKDNGTVWRICEKYADVCLNNYGSSGVPCLRKCCPDGETYKLGAGCLVDYDNGLDMTSSDRILINNDSEYAIIHNYGKKYYATDDHSFTVYPGGNVRIKIKNKWSTYTSEKVSYCVENVTSDGENFAIEEFILSGLVTYYKFPLKTVAAALSIIFLGLTIICYLLLPEMHNLHGKSILMHCVILFIGFLTVAFAQSVELSPVQFCQFVGFTLMFSFLGAFSWLNIICFDMWMAFGTLRVLDINNKRKELKKFLWYNLYGWGVPVVLTTFAVVAYEMQFLPKKFTPEIGNMKCFFDNSSGYDQILYFVLPMTIMIVANCILFYKTVKYCYHVKNEIQKMKERNKDKKNKFKDDNEKMMMLLKLFILMGISWFFEVVATLINFKENTFLEVIETIWDTFNSLQGVFIFAIFIMKRKVYNSLKEKCGCARTRKQSECSMTMTTNVTTNGRNI